MAWGGYGWRRYVPVAQRRARAQRELTALSKRGVAIQPVEIAGRNITSSFWGKAWCDHLESFSDYANRLPRGRSYVRNGSVCHLEITEGEIRAKVAGSELYDLRIRIKTLPAPKWKEIKTRCAGQVASLLELLQGRFSDHVMKVVANRKDGLFPLPGEISLNCSCPDWAEMCKHLAAALYGVGARLDARPELLFALRGVNHEELLASNAEAAVSAATARGTSRRLADGELSDVFGIDLDTSDDSDDSDAPSPARKKGTLRTTRSPRKKASKPTATKKSPRKSTTKTAKKSAKKKTRSVGSAKKPATKSVKKTAKKKHGLASALPAAKKKVTKKAARRKPAAAKTARQPR